MSAAAILGMTWAVMEADSSQQSTQELQAAFELFNSIAGSLQQSYVNLEGQTQALREELARVQKHREEERRQTRRANRKLENLLQCLPGGVVLLDSHGYVEDCNPVAMDILGAPLSGELWLDVIERAFRPQLDDGHEISLHDGRRISLATRSLDEEPGQLILLTDLTETRRLQDKLHHNERLTEMGKMMAALAHQLRTPLSSALLYCDHLVARNLPVERQRKFAAKVKLQLAAIEQQIRDMLVFARSDLPITERIVLSSLLQSLADRMADKLDVSKIEYHTELPTEDVELICNREVLLGALGNLVINALQAEGTRTIRVRASLALGDSVAVEVLDDGSGFDVNEQELFFSNKPLGTGLGLAVVQAVVAAHQGRFELFSKRGQGTRAVVTLPIAPKLASP